MSYGYYAESKETVETNLRNTMLRYHRLVKGIEAHEDSPESLLAYAQSLPKGEWELTATRHADIRRDKGMPPAMLTYSLPNNRNYSIVWSITPEGSRVEVESCNSPADQVMRERYVPLGGSADGTVSPYHTGWNHDGSRLVLEHELRSLLSRI